MASVKGTMNRDDATGLKALEIGIQPEENLSGVYGEML